MSRITCRINDEDKEYLAYIAIIKDKEGLVSIDSDVDIMAFADILIEIHEEEEAEHYSFFTEEMYSVKNFEDTVANMYINMAIKTNMTPTRKHSEVVNRARMKMINLAKKYFLEYTEVYD